MIRDDFYKIIQDNNYQYCVEIGVQRGDFAIKLLQASCIKKLFLIDSWQYIKDYHDIANVHNDTQQQIYSDVCNKFKDNNKVEIIKDFSIEASHRFEDNFFDFIYLDADHSYEGVKNDLLHWFPKLKKTGILSGHDYLDGTIDAGNFGVKSAVDEFCKKNNYIINLTDEKEWKSWYIKK